MAFDHHPERRIRQLHDELRSGRDVLRHRFPVTPLPGHDLAALPRPRGLPSINRASRFPANAVLDPLDHFVKGRRRVRGYVRRADDPRVFGDSKTELHARRRAIEGLLAKLRLVLHARESQLPPCRARESVEAGRGALPGHRRCGSRAAKR